MRKIARLTYSLPINQGATEIVFSRSPQHQKLAPTMATNFSFSNRNTHFHFLSQKTWTANPVLGHGMIKLPRPSRIPRFGIRALSGSRRLQLDGKPIRLPCGEIMYRDEKAILDLLEKRDVSLNTADALELSEILEYIGEKQRLNDLYDMIKKKHISSMWRIAGSNDSDSAAAMLPREPRSLVEWSGKSGIINGASWLPPFPLAGNSKEHRRFPLKGKFKMKIVGSYNAQEYGVVFKDKFGLLFVETNPIDAPETVKKCHLAFKIGDGKHDVPPTYIKQAKRPWPLNDQLIIYIRPAGPNVLVGQAWKTYWKAEKEPKTFWGELLLIKNCNNK